MKNAIRIDEIENYLRDGGSVDEILIETEPSDRKRVWSKIGKEIDQDRENVHRERGWWK
jgi:hypothetical protein